jgi:hypothetical protein
MICKRLRRPSSFDFVCTSGYPWPSDTVRRPCRSCVRCPGRFGPPIVPYAPPSGHWAHHLAPTCITHPHWMYKRPWHLARPLAVAALGTIREYLWRTHRQTDTTFALIYRTNGYLWRSDIIRLCLQARVATFGSQDLSFKTSIFGSQDLGFRTLTDARTDIGRWKLSILRSSTGARSCVLSFSHHFFLRPVVIDRRTHATLSLFFASSGHRRTYARTQQAKLYIRLYKQRVSMALQWEHVAYNSRQAIGKDKSIGVPHTVPLPTNLFFFFFCGGAWVTIISPEI